MTPASAPLPRGSSLMTMTLSRVHSMPAEVDGLAVRDPRDAAAKAGLEKNGDRQGCQRYKDRR